jgi:hypothetical protein
MFKRSYNFSRFIGAARLDMELLLLGFRISSGESVDINRSHELMGDRECKDWWNCYYCCYGRKRWRESARAKAWISRGSCQRLADRYRPIHLEAAFLEHVQHKVLPYLPLRPPGRPNRPNKTKYRDRRSFRAENKINCPITNSGIVGYEALAKSLLESVCLG